MSTEQIKSIPLSLITESPTNPRKTFSAAALQELAESIKAIGLQQPIRVRPHPRLTGFECVFGHRRLRATRLAGLEAIEAVVRDMSDAEVAKAQLHENLAREDVNPIEEAEGFERLMREHGVTASQLIADTGKSKSYIYGRLKLNKLCTEVRQAVAEQSLPADVGIKIGRIPSATLQRKALDDVRGREYVDGKGRQPSGWKSQREALETLEGTDYFIPIANAIFSTDDASLHPLGRTCADCAHCSPNDPELTEAFSEPTCTDTECFQQRTRAHVAQLIERYRAEGLLLEGEEAEKASASYFPAYICRPDEYIETRMPLQQPGDSMTIAEGIAAALKEDPSLYLPLRYVAVNPNLPSGDERPPKEVMRRSHLETLWSALGMRNPWSPTPSNAARSEGGSNAEGEDHDETPGRLPLPLTEEEQAARDNWPEIRTAIGRRVLATPRTTAEMRMIVATTVEAMGELPDWICELMGWTETLEELDLAYGDDAEWLLNRLAAYTADELARLAVLLALDSAPVAANHGDLPAAMVALAKAYGVNPLDPDAPPAEPASTPSGAAQAAEGSGRRNAAKKPLAPINGELSLGDGGIQAGCAGEDDKGAGNAGASAAASVAGEPAEV